MCAVKKRESFGSVWVSFSQLCPVLTGGSRRKNRLPVFPTQQHTGSGRTSKGLFGLFSFENVGAGPAREAELSLASGGLFPGTAKSPSHNPSSRAFRGLQRCLTPNVTQIYTFKFWSQCLESDSHLGLMALENVKAPPNNACIRSHESNTDISGISTCASGHMNALGGWVIKLEK